MNLEKQEFSKASAVVRSVLRSDERDPALQSSTKEESVSFNDDGPHGEGTGRHVVDDGMSDNSRNHKDTRRIRNRSSIHNHRSNQAPHRNTHSWLITRP